MSKKARRQPPRRVPNHHGGTPDPENHDETPVEMPLHACRPTPLNELIARMVHQHVEAEKNEGFETFEESNDFEEEDPEVLDMSPYELSELPPDPELETEAGAAASYEVPGSDQTDEPPPSDSQAGDQPADS